MPNSRKPAVVVHAPPGRRKPLADPEPPPALHRSQATAKAFWSLMDRWQVPDEKAPLRLLDHVGRLTAAGKRPRFAMTGDEAKKFAYLMEIDTALQAVVSDAPGWLVRKHQAFGNTMPLDQMASAERGMARVHRFLVRAAMLR